MFKLLNVIFLHDINHHFSKLDIRQGEQLFVQVYYFIYKLQNRNIK